MKNFSLASLALATATALSPVASHAQGLHLTISHNLASWFHVVQTPEGGDAVTYLLMAGASFGGVLYYSARSKFSKSK